MEAVYRLTRLTLCWSFYKISSSFLFKLLVFYEPELLIIGLFCPLTRFNFFEGPELSSVFSLTRLTCRGFMWLASSNYIPVFCTFLTVSSTLRLGDNSNIRLGYTFGNIKCSSWLCSCSCWSPCRQCRCVRFCNSPAVRSMLSTRHSRDLCHTGHFSRLDCRQKLFTSSCLL